MEGNCPSHCGETFAKRHKIRGAPIKLVKPLNFCSYSGSACCGSAKDMQLQKRFQALNVSDTECASILKSILCSACNQFSAQLFEIDSGLRNVPVLCNSTVTTKSPHLSSGASIDFCGKVWDTCRNVSISNSPFVTSKQSSTSIDLSSFSLKLTDQWRSKKDFCELFGGSSAEGGVCFDGESVSFKNGEALQHPEGLCLEKIENGVYLNLIPHPDGSNRVFLSNQKGKIWLANVPDVDSSETLRIVEPQPFLDISDQLVFDTEFGLMGMAFHPNFANNGRSFLSFNCDKMKQKGCLARCSCNTDVNCDPSMIAADNKFQPCQYHSVIAEFTVNGTAPRPSMAKRANPLEVRKILTVGLPYRGGHAGQLLFGPADGYLYFTMGDGARKDDPYNFAQNKKSLLGKILRFDIDNIPSEKEINDLGLWGNYSIPKDNPYVGDKELAPEIWAFGFRNPWRCSFDSERPSYFLCGDIGQDQYEEVDIVTKGGNYGWRVYEGPFLFYPELSPGGSTPLSSINPIFPIIGYNHSEVDKIIGSASIIGGFFYRSLADACMYGRYIYMDLYGEAVWAANEYPLNSGNFTTSKIPFRCASDSPIPCSIIKGSSSPSLGYVLSFAEDNRKDLYILTSTGVYRFARPSRCNFRCSKEIVANLTSRSHSSSSISVKDLRGCRFIGLIFFFVLVPILNL
ncbi:hypothetical protein DITRI_Ditri04bG0059100 [Diplodiscus trichospermus]